MAGKTVFPSGMVTFVVEGLPGDYMEQKIAFEESSVTQGSEPLARDVHTLIANSQVLRMQVQWWQSLPGWM